MTALLIAALIAAPDLPGTPSGWRTGLLVTDASDGTVLMEQNSTSLFRPASTVKLVTSLLALDRLGPSYVYTTEILADTTVGTIYLTGSGAPLLSAEDVARAAMETAARLGRNGTWDLRYDETCFTGEQHLPGWDSDDWSRAYCPPVEAICIGDNILEIVVSSVDGVVRTWTYPPLADLVLDLDLTIGPLESLRSLVDGWESGRPEVSLAGTIRPGTTVIVYKPFAGAPLELASWLAAKLCDNGLSVMSVSGGQAPDDSLMLRAAVMYSDPLAQIVASMNKWSRNMVAEQLMRTVSLEECGPPGSTGSGCDLAGEMLARLVPDGPAVQLADGSGLSRLDRLAPVHLAAVIRAGASSLEYGPEFLASLPVNGVDGTLSGRMADLPPGSFRGKTGTLNDTCAIAGILHAESGRTLVVVIMLEVGQGQVYRARNWQDEAITALYGAY
jgi:D-alanyl-D-alanine carboxypeptidase/D-alanyl-D-alanine-endopeptidase (penicillin-binding protein 4)